MQTQSFYVNTIFFLSCPDQEIDDRYTNCIDKDLLRSMPTSGRVYYTTILYLNVLNVDLLFNKLFP